MPWGFAAAAVAGVAGAAISGDAASSAANTEAGAAKDASQVQLDMFNKTQANEQPYLQAGTNALPYLQSGLGVGGGNTSGVGDLNRPFTLADFHSSPGYQFQVQQGEDAILNNASRTGGVNSGNTLKALTQFGTGVANQDYWNAYNQFTTGQNTRFNQLQTLTGSGQNAAGNLGALGANVGASIGTNIVGAGNANAAGQVAGANAVSGGINNIASNFLLANAMNPNMFNFGGTPPGQSSGPSMGWS